MKKLCCKLLGHRFVWGVVSGAVYRRCERCGASLYFHWLTKAIAEDKRRLRGE